VIKRNLAAKEVRKGVVRMELRRKTFVVKISQDAIEKMAIPDKTKGVFKLLGKEQYLGIKGGYAKVPFGELLKRKEERQKTLVNRALGSNGASVDLDIVINYIGSRENALPKLVERVDILTKKLQEIGVYLNGADVEPREGNVVDKKFLTNFLSSRDITINEIIAVPTTTGDWKLCFTDLCYRDTLNGAGIIAPNGKGTLRWDYGRLVPTPNGIVRLVRFLTEKKVNSIYLPQWHIERNNQEAERMGKEKLGAYGLILCQRYLNTPIFQQKLMRILNILDLTDILNFQDYIREQETFFQLWHENSRFQFNNQRTFEEVQKHLNDKSKREKTDLEQKRTQQKHCLHQNIETIECNYCGKHCTIKVCKDCKLVNVFMGKSIKPAKLLNLLCNRNSVNGTVYWDKQGFVWANGERMKIK